MLLKVKYPSYYTNSQAGIDVHPSDFEISEFLEVAKKISPKTEFTTHGCMECLQSMIKLVFDKEEVLVKKEDSKKEQ